MSEYVIKVKLEDGTLAEFKSFVIVGKTSEMEVTIKEFNDLQDAKESIQKMQQEEVLDFLKAHHCFVTYNNTNQTMLINSFIDWYANLDVFDKCAFLKLLEKVVKINE